MPTYEVNEKGRLTLAGLQQIAEDMPDSLKHGSGKDEGETEMLRWAYVALIQHHAYAEWLAEKVEMILLEPDYGISSPNFKARGYNTRIKEVLELLKGGKP